MASPNLPEGITAGVTTGHVTDHEKIHDLLNEFDMAAQAQATGDLLVFQDGLIKRLPVGSDDQVLTADSGEPAGVKWAAGGGGGGGSGLLGEEEASTDVNFLELEIPSGATDVRLTGLLRVTVNSQFGMMDATVGNGTVDTGSNYKWGYRWVSNSSTGAADSSVTDSKIDLGGGNFPGANSPAGVFAVLDMLIPGYDDTTRDKFMSWTVRKWRANSGTLFVFAQGWAMWDSTAAIDVIRFTPASDQIAAGSVIRAFAG